MLAELFDRIANQAVRAHGPAFLGTEAIHDRVWLKDCEGNLEEIQKPPPLRGHTLHSLQDVIAVCKDADMSALPEIHYNAGGITVFLDRDKRSERATLSMKMSKRFEMLQHLERAPESLDVPAAVKYLRFKMHGVGADNVIQALKRVDFTRTSAGTNVVEHGKESLGRSVEAEAQSVGEVPEEIAMTVPVFSNPGCESMTALVRVGVYLDVHNQRVEFGVLADESTRAINESLSKVRTFLRDNLTKVPIFHSAP